MRVFKLRDGAYILKWLGGVYIHTGSRLDHDVVFNFPEVIVQNGHIRKMNEQEENHYKKYLKYSYVGVYACESPVSLKKDILKKGVCEELSGEDVISFLESIDAISLFSLRQYTSMNEEEYVWKELIRNCGI